jgi:glycosyltransferase involved in cell wall biosynthesis
MRIMLGCQSYFPAGGGVARVNKEIAERLAARGHDVVVATGMAGARCGRDMKGVEVREFDVSGNRVRGLRGEIARYQEYVVSGGFDAIMIYAAQQWTFDALWPVLSMINARKIHIPCGYSGFYDLTYRNYYRQMPGILRQFDHLIYNACDYRDINFARELGLMNYSVIPNGAGEEEFAQRPESDFRRKWGIADDEFIFLTVGSPPSLKGHREVALAYAQIQLPFPSLLILDGRYDALENPLLQTVPLNIKRLFVRMAKRMLRRPLFPFQGFRKAMDAISRQDRKRFFLTDMPRSELISAFFSSNLFVFASHVEYSPLVLFEAVAAGLPFLSVPAGNAEEVAAWTKGGEICAANQDGTGHTMVSPDALAQAMTRLANDPERLLQLGSKGRENWKKCHTWEKIVSQYEAVITNGVPAYERSICPQANCTFQRVR